jgi:uracil-DNA glycosylase family 4
MHSAGVSAAADPSGNCSLCSRLVEYRRQQRLRQPAWHNAPVVSFGDPDARLLILGLAPGIGGANRTGRPFTGDEAGRLLYATLAEFGFSRGVYDAEAGDGLKLADSLVTNAVRCVPPQNKPLPSELAACRPFLVNTMAQMHRLRIVVALGRVAHESVVRAFLLNCAAFPFSHGAKHALVTADGRQLLLFDSYHCSRYNTNTGVLTPEMFRAVFASVRASLDGRRPRSA